MGQGAGKGNFLRPLIFCGELFESCTCRDLAPRYCAKKPLKSMTYMVFAASAQDRLAMLMEI